MTSGRRFCGTIGSWLVLSIDGPQELHDRFRVDKGGQPTFNKVFAAGQLLHRYNVPFNTLTVVNRVNAKSPLDVYKLSAQ